MLRGTPLQHQPIVNKRPQSSWKERNVVFLALHSEFQETDSSCGPAVLVDVLKTLGHSVSQEEIIREVNNELLTFGASLQVDAEGELIEEHGTPPDIMISILNRYGVDFEVKESVPALKKEIENEDDAPVVSPASPLSFAMPFTGIAQENKGTKAAGFFEKYYYKVKPVVTEASRNYLLDKLHQGFVIITPVQDIPNIGEKRDIESDGHYVAVCGHAQIDGKQMLIILDPFNDSDREMSTGAWGVAKRGIRFVDINTFMPIWQDVDWKGTPFVQYGIAVRVS